ncbi:MAG: hypothetical protein MHPSP_000676 [Paramarteilia canceri]
MAAKCLFLCLVLLAISLFFAGLESNRNFIVNKIKYSYETLYLLRESCSNHGRAIWRIEDSLANNPKYIEKFLKQSIFGQDLAIEKLSFYLSSHLSKKYSRKSLSLLLTGYTGIGKTFTSHKIADLIFKKGIESKYFLHIQSNYLFTSLTDSSDSKTILKNMLLKQIKLCPKSVIVIDEADKLPQGIIDTILPFIQHGAKIEGMDFTHAIFLLISNVAGETINQLYIDNWLSGQKEEIVQDDLKFHRKIVTEIVGNNQLKGFYQSDILKRLALDDIVIFSPLQRKHVAQCIDDSLKKFEDTNRILKNDTIKQKIKAKISE